MGEIRYGMACLRRGVVAYYTSPRLWKYGLIPLLILFVAYLLVMAGLIVRGIPYLTELLLPDPAAWNAALRWLIHAGRVLIWISILAGATLCSLLLLTTLFEALGAIFFDELVIRFEEQVYGERFEPLSWGENLRYLGQSLRYSAGTAFWTLLLTIPALLIPAAGLLPTVAVIGFRFGLSYTFSSAFIRRIDVDELRRRVRPHRAALTGFGGLSYLLLMIPFGAVFLLPGFALGGSIFFHERLNRENRPSSGSAPASPLRAIPAISARRKRPAPSPRK